MAGVHPHHASGYSQIWNSPISTIVDLEACRMVCGRCGTRVESEDSFCSHCGNGIGPKPVISVDPGEPKFSVAPILWGLAGLIAGSAQAAGSYGPTFALYEAQYLSLLDEEIEQEKEYIRQRHRNLALSVLRSNMQPISSCEDLDDVRQAIVGDLHELLFQRQIESGELLFFGFLRDDQDKNGNFRHFLYRVLINGYVMEFTPRAAYEASWLSGEMRYVLKELPYAFE